MNRQSGLFFFCILFVLQNIYAQESEAVNKIQSLNITETENETYITLTGTDKINYTIFKMDEPPRATLDLGNADLEDLKNSYSVDNGIVKDIKIITEVEGGLPISRIEINMEKLMDFSATQEDKKLLITVSKVTPYKPPESQPEAAQEEEGLLGEIPPEPGAPEEGTIPEGIGEELGTEIATPELGAPEVLGIPGEVPETGTPPAPEGETEIALGAPLPEEKGEGETIPEEELEELPEESETVEEGDIAIEEEPTFAEGELPGVEEIPETAPEVEGATIAPEVLPEGEAGAIAVAETPPEGEAETPEEEESIEGIIEKSEIPPEPIAPEVVTAPPEEEKLKVLAQASTPVEVTPPPPPVPEKKEKLAWIKGNKIVTSEKIRFNPNEAVLPIEYESIVQEIAKILNENPEIKIRIEGYTDSVGDYEFNRALSEYRAIWLKLLLERFGVSPDRIQVAGMGEGNPIASNDTEKGREKNRRVEFIIIQK